MKYDFNLFLKIGNHTLFIKSSVNEFQKRSPAYASKCRVSMQNVTGLVKVLDFFSSEFCSNLDCNYIFPIDLAPNRISFRA